MNRNNLSYSENAYEINNDQDNLKKLALMIFKKVLETTDTHRIKLINLILEHYKQILNDFLEKSTNELYQDKTFPPNENSLLKGCKNVWKLNEEEKNKINNKWAKIVWFRVNEILDHFQLFPEEIQSTDIKPGVLNDHAFLSAVSALCERPMRIKKLFLNSELEPRGVYGLKLCREGIWKEYVIDDYIPCDKKLIPCFTSSRDKSIWPLLLEKAYAKASGSYYNLENIDFLTVLSDLTAAPIKIYENFNHNLWSSLKEANEQGWIITASSGETEASKDLLKDIGLLPHYHYSVLEIHEVSIDENNMTESLIKLRNPWGAIEWSGDWSESSTLWRDDLKTKLNYSTNQDGSFWMNYKDFKHYFSKIQICQYFDDYHYNSILLKQNKQKYNLIQMNIHKASTIFLSIRHLLKNVENVKLTRYIISKINKEDNSIEYIFGHMTKETDFYSEKVLDEGEYLVYIECDSSDFVSYSFGAYSIIYVAFTNLNNDDYPNILEKIYKSCALKENQVQNFSKEGAPNCLKYANNTPEGYSYQYYVNNEEDATLIEVVKYTKFDGLQLLPPFSGTSFVLELGPKQSQIVLIKQLEEVVSLTYSYQSNFKFGQKRLLYLAKTKGKKTNRKDPKLSIDIDIVVYTYKHSLGLCFYYENNTIDRKLEETLKIKASGVELVDSELVNNEVFIELFPGEKRLIELKAMRSNWSVQSSVYYKIDYC